MVYVTLRNGITKIGRVKIDNNRIVNRVLICNGDKTKISIVDITNQLPVCLYSQDDKEDDERLKEIINKLSKTKENPPIELIDEGLKLVGVTNPNQLLNF